MTKKNEIPESTILKRRRLQARVGLVYLGSAETESPMTKGLAIALIQDMDALVADVMEAYKQEDVENTIPGPRPKTVPVTTAYLQQEITRRTWQQIEQFNFLLPHIWELPSGYMMPSNGLLEAVVDATSAYALTMLADAIGRERNTAATPRSDEQGTDGVVAQFVNPRVASVRSAHDVAWQVVQTQNRRMQFEAKGTLELPPEDMLAEVVALAQRYGQRYLQHMTADISEQTAAKHIRNEQTELQKNIGALYGDDESTLWPQTRELVSSLIIEMEDNVRPLLDRQQIRNLSNMNGPKPGGDETLGARFSRG